MVAYTSEPRVRRPADYSPTARVKPTPAPRQTLRKTRSESSKIGKNNDGANLVTDEELSDEGGSATSREDTISPDTANTSLSTTSQSTQRSNYELTSPYSRTGIYSLEGSRLQSELELSEKKTTQPPPPPVRRQSEQQEQYTSVSSNTTSIVSSSASTTGKLRSYASSRDILEMYGTIGGGAGGTSTTANHNPPLAPRMLGFSSSDLRLPPSTLLMSLSGKKSNSSLNVDWNTQGGGGGAAHHQLSVAQVKSGNSIYQNLPATLRRVQRDTVF